MQTAKITASIGTIATALALSPITALFLVSSILTSPWQTIRMLRDKRTWREFGTCNADSKRD